MKVYWKEYLYDETNPDMVSSVIDRMGIIVSTFRDTSPYNDLYATVAIDNGDFIKIPLRELTHNENIL